MPLCNHRLKSVVFWLGIAVMFVLRTTHNPKGINEPNLYIHPTFENVGFWFDITSKKLPNRRKYNFIKNKALLTIQTNRYSTVISELEVIEWQQEKEKKQRNPKLSPKQNQKKERDKTY